MDSRRRIRASKFLSLVLRHRPERVALTLDESGWADVDELLAALASAGIALTRDELFEVVETNDKQRFALSEDRRRIRASQGHSIEIDLAYPPATPPDVLFHGTAQKNLAKIRAEGLLRGQRQHVHLSTSEATAVAVGRRHGKPVVLSIDAARLTTDGHRFYISANGVWLIEHVPPDYIRFP